MGNTTQGSLAKAIYIVDGSLDELDLLVSALPVGAVYFILDPSTDGLEQMADIVSRYSELEAIHILSHGTQGSLCLGSAVLDKASLETYSPLLTAIGDSLMDTGDLLLYGCNIAQGQSGQEFIDALALITGADVAASTDMTGAVSCGGDWQLEAVAGQVETAALSSDLLNNEYSGMLAGASFSTAELITIGQSQSEQLETSSTVEYFKFTVKNPGTYVIYSTGNTDTQGRLFDATFQQVAFNEDGVQDDNFSITAMLASGTYYLQVTGDDLLDSGPYQVHVGGGLGLNQQNQILTDPLSSVTVGTLFATLVYGDIQLGANPSLSSPEVAEYYWGTLVAQNYWGGGYSVSESGFDDNYKEYFNNNHVLGQQWTILDGSNGLALTNVSADTQAAFTSGGLYHAYVDAPWNAANQCHTINGTTYGDSNALVAVSGDTLVLSFRGTDSMDEAFLGGQAWTGDGEYLHYQAFRPLIAAVKNYLDSHASIKHVIVSGHSLGGAMADLFTAIDARYFAADPDTDLAIVSLASPGIDPDVFTETNDPQAFLDYDASVVQVNTASDTIQLSLPTSFYFGIAHNQDRVYHDDITEFGGLLPNLSLQGNVNFPLSYQFNLPNIANDDVDYGLILPYGFGAHHNSLIYSRNMYEFCQASVPYANQEVIFGVGDYVFGLAVEGVEASGWWDSSYWDDSEAVHDFLTGSSNDNFIFGLEGDDYIYGNGGNDYLCGGDGNDWLCGGSGQDILEGGVGNDTYYVEDVADYIVETNQIAEEIDTVESAISWTLGENLENLTLSNSPYALSAEGNGLDNAIWGNGYDNIFYGSAGSDVFYGGSGYGDCVDYSSLASSITVSGNEVTKPEGEKDALHDISRIIGTGYSDSFTKNDANSWCSYEGNGGDDVFDLSAGSGTVYLYTDDGEQNITINGFKESDYLYIDDHLVEYAILDQTGINSIVDEEIIYLVGNDLHINYKNKINITIKGENSDFSAYGFGSIHCVKAPSVYANGTTKTYYNNYDYTTIFSGAEYTFTYGYNNIIKGVQSVNVNVNGQYVDVPAINILSVRGNIAFSRIENVKVLDVDCGDVYMTSEQLNSFEVIGNVSTYLGYCELHIIGGGVASLQGKILTYDQNPIWLIAETSYGTTLIGNDQDGQCLEASSNGDDTLIAGNGDNVTLRSGNGNCTLVGGNGNNNNLVVGGNNCTVTGGAGVDNLIFQYYNDGAVYDGTLRMSGGGGDDCFEWALYINTDYMPSDSILDGGTGRNTLDITDENSYYTFDCRHLSTVTVRNIQVLRFSNAVEISAAQLSGFDTLEAVGSAALYLAGGGTFSFTGKALSGDFSLQITGDEDTTIVGPDRDNQTLTAGDGETAHYTLRAGNGANIRLVGGAGSCSLIGGSGNDELHCYRDLTAHDVIDGNDGQDILFVDEVADISLATLAHVETIQCSVWYQASLTLTAQQLGGLDTISTGDALTGIQILAATAGTYDLTSTTIIGTSVLRAATPYAGSFVFKGNATTTSITGGYNNDTLVGNTGNDLLNGNFGADIMIGNVGNDTYHVDNVGDVTTESSTVATEIDTVISSVSRTLGANLEKLTLIGTGAINGTGNNLNNTLVGNTAANVLNGGAGTDTMIGGTGNDTYYVDNAADVTTESSAVATEIDTEVSTVSRTLGANIEKLVLNGTAAINGTGNTLNNILVGNTAANVLNGSIGIDTLIGGLGNDTYYVDNASDVTTESSTLATEIDTVVSSVTRALGANLERLTLSGTAAINGTGNALNNTLVGNSAANVLNGGTGIDTMIGGLGNDTYYVDNASDVTTESSALATEIDTVVSSVTRTLGANLERLTLGGTAAINGTGNSLNNTLVGNSGANLLNGGSGIDTMIGGTGNDTYHVDNASDVTTESSTLATEIDTVVSTVTRTLGANLERLTLSGTASINGTGNALNNTLVGNSAANVLNGGTGIDTMIGGLGNDTYYVDNASDVTTESSALATEIDTVVSSVTRTLGANLERLTLSGTAAINGTGNSLNNTLVGNSGANLLNGSTGIDTMIGGLGNDTYYVDNASDVTTESSALATEIDTVVSSVTRTLGANLERLILSGTAAINGTGNTLNNTLVGNSAANVFNGGTGIDTMIGGLGNDTYYVDNAGDVTTESSTLATEIDTVVSTVTRTLGANLERLTLSGTSAINGTGNTLNNTLVGNSAANVLNGGTGIDTMIGGLGNDTYYVDNASDVTTESSTLATEIDTVVSTVTRTLGTNLEKLVLTGTVAINGTGNTLNNTLVGNSAANVLNGGTGIDTMIGGLGNDTYYVDNASDVTTESSTLATEIDTVVSTVTRTLGANIEKLTLSGTSAINGTGNTLNNTLVGNSAANVLNGGTGIDTMIGGLGNDTYYVDNASDVTTESSALATEIDTVVSTVTRTLGANLERLTLSGTATINGTGNTLNNTLTGNTAANVLNGNSGNDVLNGGLGNDTLIGGAGIDTFVFDSILNATTNRDTLTDFSVTDDTLRLDRTVFAKLTTLGGLNTAFFRSSTTGAATDSNDYILYNTSTGALAYDTDGNGACSAIQFATLTTKPSLTAADFVVVA